MTLTLSATVVAMDVVTVSYAKPATDTDNTLKHANGNEAAKFTDQAVTNTNTDATCAATITGTLRGFWVRPAYNLNRDDFPYI